MTRPRLTANIHPCSNDRSLSEFFSLSGARIEVLNYIMYAVSRPSNLPSCSRWYLGRYVHEQSAQSPLLRTAAEDGVFRVVRWLFLRLPGTQETPLRDTTAAAAAARLQTYSKMQHPSSGSAIGAFRNEAVQQPTGNAPTSEGDTVGHGKGKYMNDSKKNPSKVDVNSSPTEAWAGSGKGGALNTLHRPATERAGTAAAAVLATAENGRRCGLPCVVNVFGFLCSQLLKHGGGGGRSGFSGSGSAAVGGSSGGGGGSAPTPRRVLCLRLMRTALAAAGSALALYPPLLEMVQDDLFFSLMHLLQRRWAGRVCDMLAKRN